MHAKTPTHTFAKAKRPWNDPVANPPKGHRAFIPSPHRSRHNLTLDLETILPGIGAQVEKHGKLVFHVIGDTGGIHGTETQEALASAMQKQIEDAAEGDAPRFMYHLGDVVYFNGQPEGYQSQFYEPYQHLDIPIFAVPGNHDNGGDPKLWATDGANQGTKHPLQGFLDNFCSARAVHLFKHRTAMTQPYCYWTLKTPLFNIIGLNSNVDGLLDAPGTTEQVDYLTGALKTRPTQSDGVCRALVAVHHPPYSLDTNHGGYGAIGEAIDSAGKPAAVFSGHVHNYQWFNRDKTPYVIAGAGGYANTPRAMHHVSKPQAGPGTLPYQTTLDDVQLVSYEDKSPGFLRITAYVENFKAEYFIVPFGTDEPKLYDSFTF